MSSSSSSSSSEKIIITVTGAGGYAASHIVKQLLERENVIVRGTVRSSKDESKIGFLKQLPGAAERLQFFEADLMKEGSFDEAIQGIYIVYIYINIKLKRKKRKKEIETTHTAANYINLKSFFRIYAFTHFQC